MKYQTCALLLAALAGSGAATPLARRHASLKPREVPQEHSHNFILDLVRTSLNKNNPRNIQDPVFALLGNDAAAAGAGDVTDLDCLQQVVADQAFTNAKADGDTSGMAGALMFRAIEHNSKTVGGTSADCTETPANPEIAALSQHQDPASADAANVNRAITLELARQLAGIGADPLLALDTGTFAPGSTSDTTGAGNSCDNEDDEPGCIYSQRSLVLDATPEEISSVVAGVSQTFTGTGVLSATQISFSGLPVGSGTVQLADIATTAAATTAAAAAAAAVTAAASQTCAVLTTTVAAAQASASLALGTPLSRRSAFSPRAAADFGSCSDPAIVFAAGLDGRTESAFEPANLDDFNHGSADNIGIIAGFICGQLGTACSASSDAVASCSSASAAAVATTQNQAAADAFNAAIGVSGGDAAVAATTAAAAVTASTDDDGCDTATTTVAAVTAAATSVSSVVMTVTMCI
ncbi:hypothetical protein GGR56DRAFT_657418 [Xylariaceae sp. FL0804]|nr:hypothetical protein GGR56DRAFT_657418 [Xylariaceae sp. FL0804]